MSDGPRFAKIPARASGLGLDGSDWDVFHVICLHADVNGHAYPSMGTIARKIGISRNNIPRVLDRLEHKFRLIRRERFKAPRGKWQANRYQVIFEPIEITKLGATQAESRLSGPDDVITIDGIAVSFDPITGCHPSGCQCVITSDALTDHRTELTKEEVVQVESKIEGVRGLDPLRPCCAYVQPTSRGYLCNKPSIIGTDRCPDHTSICPEAAGMPVAPCAHTPPAPTVAAEHGCSAYVTNDHGYHICAKPIVPGTDHCAAHAAAFARRMPSPRSNFCRPDNWLQCTAS